MSTLALAVGIGLLAHVAWRRDVLTPPALFLGICVASMAAFYAVAVAGWRPDTMLTWWQIAGTYDAVAPRVMLFYLGLATIGYLAWQASRLFAPPPPARDQMGDAIPDLATAALTRPPVAFAWLTLLLLCLWHAFAIDWTPLLHSADHLEARRPAGVSLTNPILVALHRNLPMLGCLLAPVVVIAARGRSRLVTATLTLTFAYIALVSLGIGTRFFILQLALLTLCLFVTRPGSRKGSAWPAINAAAFTVLAYLVFAATRRGKTYGLEPTLHTLISGGFITADLPLYVGLSVFGGPFTLAEALLRGEIAYPPAYQYLSFSPLPSSLDGFAAIRDAAQHRVMDRAPFGGVAEAYLFGPGHLLALLVILLVALILLGAFWRKHRGAAAMLVLAPACYGLAAIHLYALRNPLRWLVLSTLVAAVVLLIDQWRRRLGAPSRVVFAGTLPPPVTGRTLATRCVLDALQRRGAVRVLDVSGGSRRGLAFRAAKLARTARAVALLVAIPRAPGAALYLVANHAHGLWYDALFVALGRMRGYRIFLHHQVYSYVTGRNRRMALIHRLMRKTDTHIVLSARMGDEFRATYPGERQYFTLSNAIVTLSEPTAPRRASLRPTVLGHLGNLTIAKGLDLALKTFIAARDGAALQRLVLAGPVMGTVERAAIDDAVLAAGEAIACRGPVRDADKTRFFAEIDVLLMPTRYANEAEPLVIAEALHHGVPVIAYARGCIPEQVGDAGVAINPSDDFTTSATAALTRWSTDPTAWRAVRDAAHRVADRQSREARGQLQRLIDAMTLPAAPATAPPLHPAEAA